MSSRIQIYNIVCGSARCGRLTVTQEKGYSESDGFESRTHCFDRKSLVKVYRFLKNASSFLNDYQKI